LGFSVLEAASVANLTFVNLLGCDDMAALLEEEIIFDFISQDLILDFCLYHGSGLNGLLLDARHVVLG
jgi:hypothetical protein